MSDDAIVKKINPYPIRATLDIEGFKFEGQIKKLVEHGFLVEVDENILLINKRGTVVFEIPVIGVFINTAVKVIKTYDRFNGISNVEMTASKASRSAEIAKPSEEPKAVEGKKENKKISRLVEMHFLLLTDEKLEAIKTFLKKSNKGSSI